MWETTIAEKKLKDGVLSVVVSFTKDGKYDHAQILIVNTLDDLNRRVRSALQRLEALELEADKIPLGEFNPTPESSVPDPQKAALAELQKQQQLVDLKIIDDSHPDYVAALAAAKTAFP